MRFYTELSNAELLALTSEQIDDLAKLELIKNGLALPYPKPEAIKIEDFEEQVIDTLFAVGHWFFKTKEEAEAACDALEKSVRTDTEYMPGVIPNLEVKPVGGYGQNSRPGIELKYVYTKESAKRIGAHFKDVEAAQKPLREWEKTMAQFNEARSEILEKIYQVQRTIREQEQRNEYMQECLRLADNDKLIAQRFFEKRFPPEVPVDDGEAD